MAERGTAEFYREQAARLTWLAAEAKTPAARIALLEMAAAFQRLAERAIANRNARPVGAIGADSA